jgi:hypothetical protein
MYYLKDWKNRRLWRLILHIDCAYYHLFSPAMPNEAVVGKINVVEYFQLPNVISISIAFDFSPAKTTPQCHVFLSQGENANVVLIVLQT